jgi:hypothetical protein
LVLASAKVPNTNGLKSMVLKIVSNGPTDSSAVAKCAWSFWCKFPKYTRLTCHWNLLTAANPRGSSLACGHLYYTALLWITLTSVNWSPLADRLMFAIPVCLSSRTYPFNCFPKRRIA